MCLKLKEDDLILVNKGDSTLGTGGEVSDVDDEIPFAGKAWAIIYIQRF